MQGPQGPKGDSGLPGVQGHPGLKVSGTCMPCLCSHSVLICYLRRLKRQNKHDLYSFVSVYTQFNRSRRVYKHVAFLFLHMVCLFVYMQGEKGEPGFVVAADGSMMSGQAGPIGPKGVKVIHIFEIQIIFLIFLHLRGMFGVCTFFRIRVSV